MRQITAYRTVVAEIGSLDAPCRSPTSVFTRGSRSTIEISGAFRKACGLSIAPRCHVHYNYSRIFSTPEKRPCVGTSARFAKKLRCFSGREKSSTPVRVQGSFRASLQCVLHALRTQCRGNAQCIAKKVQFSCLQLAIKQERPGQGTIVSSVLPARRGA